MTARDPGTAFELTSPTGRVTRIRVGLLLFASLSALMHAQTRPARLIDTPVATYTLPDPLVTNAGAQVTDVATWTTQRRPELLEAFSREVYGRTPAWQQAGMHAEISTFDREALNGLATRKEVTIWFTPERSGPAVHLLLYVPNVAAATVRRPVFLGLNFYGNHTVSRDPGISLSTAWIPADAPGVVDHHATDAARGSDAGKWPIETILSRGYAVATVYCGDLCPDRTDGLAEGVNGWLSRTTTENRAPDAWGAVGVWAWGLSRALDYLQTDPDVDGRRVALHGHSRLGKAALWAGAQDERFALVISNESGCGGAALSKRLHGETVERINAVFPHWFAKNFRRYNNNESALPVDQHELLALIAPRPLYVASAEGDDWADPRGEFLAAKGAEPVYALFGLTGPTIRDVPSIHTPTGDAVRYHIRTGPHSMTDYDWTCYLNFADRWLGDRTPTPAPAPAS